MSNLLKAVRSGLQCFSPGYDHNHKFKWKLCHCLKLNPINGSSHLKMATVDSAGRGPSNSGQLRLFSAEMHMEWLKHRLCWSMFTQHHPAAPPPTTEMPVSPSSPVFCWTYRPASLHFLNTSAGISCGRFHRVVLDPSTDGSLPWVQWVK